MKKLKNTHIIMLFITFILSIFTAIYRCFIEANLIEKETGLYTDNLSKNIFFGIVLVAAILAFGVFLYFKKAGIKTEKIVNGVFTKIASLLCVISLSVYTVYSFTNISKWYEVLDIITAVCSVVFFAIICFKGTKNDKNKVCFGVLEMLVSLFLAYKTIFLFIDTTTQMNASSRSYTLLFMICAMLFFLFEASLYIFKTGDPCANTHCFYAFGYFSVFLAISVCLPALIMFSNTYSAGTPFITNIVYITMGIYISSRLMSER